MLRVNSCWLYMCNKDKDMIYSSIFLITVVSYKYQKSANFEILYLRSHIGQHTIQVTAHLDQEENVGSQENSFTAVFNGKKLF